MFVPLGFWCSQSPQLLPQATVVTSNISPLPLSQPPPPPKTHTQREGKGLRVLSNVRKLGHQDKQGDPGGNLKEASLHKETWS